MEEYKGVRFATLYQELRKKHPSLVEINVQEIQAIQRQSDRHIKRNITNMYISSSIYSILFLSLSPVIVIALFNSLDLIIQMVLKKQEMFFSHHVELTNLSLGIAIFSLLVVFFITPFEEKLTANPQLKKILFAHHPNFFVQGLNFKQTNVILLQVLAAYFIIGFAFYLLQFNFIRFSAFSITALKVLLLIPLYLIILISSSTIAVLTLYSVSSAVKYRFCNNVRIEISFAY